MVPGRRLECFVVLVGRFLLIIIFCRRDRYAYVWHLLPLAFTIAHDMTTFVAPTAHASLVLFLKWVFLNPS